MMLQSLTNYIAGVLLVLTVSFGYMAYSANTERATTEAQVKVLMNDLDTARSDTQKVTDSCKAAQETVERVSKLNSTLENGLQRHLERLEGLPATTLQDTKNDASKTITEGSGSYADDDRLSGPLMQLLNTAYCDANRDDSDCTAQRTPD